MAFFHSMLGFHRLKKRQLFAEKSWIRLLSLFVLVWSLLIVLSSIRGLAPSERVSSDLSSLFCRATCPPAISASNDSLLSLL